MGTTVNKAQCQTTKDNLHPEFARLPHQFSKWYINEKVKFALKTSKVVTVVTKKQTYVAAFSQAAMSGAILIEEKALDFKVWYRAEVVFNMNSTLGERAVPTPYLSNSKVDGDYRRTFNPFRKGSRRPDLIIVLNPVDLWCGRAAKDENSKQRADNLLRVAEIKFPGDRLLKPQEDAYIQIAGGLKRFTVVDVTDCNDDEGKRVRQEQKHHAEQEAKNNTKQRAALSVPIRLPEQKNDQYFYEPWLNNLNQNFDTLKRNIEDFSDSTYKFLKEQAPWLFETGTWVKKSGIEAWDFINEKGQKIATWTKQQLDAAMKEITHYTDITIEYFKEIDWYHVIAESAKTIGIVIVVVVGVFGAIAIGIPAGVVAAFSALIGIATATA